MRLSKLLCALALTLLLPTPSAWAQTEPRLAEVQQLFKAGQHAQALAKADAHIGARPKDPQGRFVKGLILAELKRTPEAIAVFRKLTEDFPELPEPYNNLAVLYAQENQYDKARQALESAIKTHPSYAVAHENLGDVYSKLASQAYGKALQIDSNNAAAQSKLALIRDLISVTARQSPRAGDAPKTGAEPTRLAAADPVKPLGALTPPPVVATPPLPALAPPPKSTANGTPPTEPPKLAVAQPTAPANVAPAAPVAPPAKPIPAAPAASAAAKPATPAPAKAAPEDPAKAVHAWASAWSRKDVRGYLAAYAADFVPPNGLSRKAWEAERAARLTKPGTIEVGVDKISVSLHGADAATVKFRQNYKSANLKTSAGKTLQLVLNNGRWLIREERVN